MLARARALWRTGRELPVARELLAAADRAWWARVIRRARVVDAEFVAAQMGRSTSDRRAIRQYVRDGFRTGFSLNPLFAESVVSRQLSDADRVPALYAYLVNDAREITVSPHWDAQAYVLSHPDSVHARGGPLGHAWRRARQTSTITLGPAGTQQRTRRWDDVHAVACEAAAEAGSAEQIVRTPDAAKSARFDETLLCLFGEEETGIGDLLCAAAEFAAVADARVIVALARPTSDDWVQAALLMCWLPNSRVLTSAADNMSSVVEDSISDVGQGVIVVRGPMSEITVRDLRAVADAGREAPTAPMWLAPDGTVAAAGFIAHSGRLVPLFAGHPPEDARILGERIDSVALAGPTYAISPATAAEAPCTLLTATVIAPRSSSALTGASDALDTDLPRLLERSRLRLTGWVSTADGADPILRPAGGTFQYGPGGETVLPRLRWAIKTAAPAGQRGESWGDTHFARGLAAALRRLGQDVVIDSFAARDRPTTSLDDISLVLRGPERIDPPATGASILWIISHPDEITSTELKTFASVFAASESWARRATSRLGVDVLPLLQCTDPQQFRPTGALRGTDIVFVGTARGIARPSVVEPLRAGVPIQVYGPDWRGYIPASAIRATGIRHAELGVRYETAAVVLNDHWPAMREAGFISNRPFDVIAAGGRVVSDAVEGIEELFAGSIRTYSSASDLVEMLSGDLDSLFADESEQALVSERIRREHSFDARAVSLISAAIAALAK